MSDFTFGRWALCNPGCGIWDFPMSQVTYSPPSVAQGLVYQKGGLPGGQSGRFMKAERGVTLEGQYNGED